MIHADRIKHHQVITRAAVFIAISKFAYSPEGHLLPKTWQVKNTKRTGGAGRNSRNDFVTHSPVMLSCLFQNSNFYFRGLLEDLNGEAEKTEKTEWRVVGISDRKILGRKIRGIAGVDMILTTNYSNNTNMNIIC